MKRFINSILFSLVFFCCSTVTAQEVEHLLCPDYWVNVDFGAFNLNQIYFDFQGEANICNADSNASYPFDERISIRIYNHFNENDAREEFDDELSYAESVIGFEEVNNLGDQAFAIMEIAFGKLDSVIIEVIIGSYTIHFDINGNAANNSNNRFTPTTVYDFARRVVERL